MQPLFRSIPVMRPHPEDEDFVFFGKNFVNNAVLEVAAGEFPGVFFRLLGIDDLEHRLTNRAFQTLRPSLLFGLS